MKVDFDEEDDLMVVDGDFGPVVTGGHFLFAGDALDLLDIGFGCGLVTFDRELDGIF